MTYALYREKSVLGREFYYIVADARLWKRGELVDENVVVSGQFGTNTYAALKAFRCIAGASEPVLPEHVPDICRDLTLELPGAMRRESRLE